MSQTIQLWFDHNVTFLGAVVAVLVCIGSASEHILALRQFVFTFKSNFKF